MYPVSVWVIFNVCLIVLLTLDLLSFRGHEHSMGLREALARSAGWVTLGLAFFGFLWLWRGSGDAVDFLTAYVVELSLSVDNLFVFLSLFGYFAVPPEYRHKVLFWGILGAMITRGGFILAGVAIVTRFHWVIYLLGLFLMWTGYKMAVSTETDVHPSKNPIVRFFRRLFPVTRRYWGSRFFIRRRGRALATPLFVVLLAVETTDIMFAVDSVPAVFAVTRIPFIAYSSNVLAVLGLRAMFFVVAGFIERFRFLHYGLAGVLIFMGAKMLLEDLFPIPTPVSLLVVASLLTSSILFSLRVTKELNSEDDRQG
jgi:tellurite resistance protein TerC